MMGMLEKPDAEMGSRVVRDEVAKVMFLHHAPESVAHGGGCEELATYDKGI